MRRAFNGAYGVADGENRLATLVRKSRSAQARPGLEWIDGNSEKRSSTRSTPDQVLLSFRGLRDRHGHGPKDSERFFIFLEQASAFSLRFRVSSAALRRPAKHRATESASVAPSWAHSRGCGGGEKQRVSIARAAIKDPLIYVFDEPTASLDSRVARTITRNFKDVAVGHTMIVVAHQFATVIDADLIVVLHDGVIVEKGTHTELLGQGGRYVELWEAQQNATTNASEREVSVA